MLDAASWDIKLTSSGRIALISDEAATAQNVANECRLFTDDAYFDQDSGIPYFVVALGEKLQNPTILNSYLRDAALLVEDVDDVTSITVSDVDPVTRVLTGEIQFTTIGGADRGAIRINI
jgi:hypothetical protein